MSELWRENMREQEEHEEKGESSMYGVENELIS